MSSDIHDFLILVVQCIQRMDLSAKYSSQELAMFLVRRPRFPLALQGAVPHHVAPLARLHAHNISKSTQSLCSSHALDFAVPASSRHSTSLQPIRLHRLFPRLRGLIEDLRCSSGVNLIMQGTGAT